MSGLMRGLGHGLMQLSGMLNQGMAADISTRRAEELDKMRQASIEKRWKLQEARASRQEAIQSERWKQQDERAQSQLNRQAERDKVSDQQFDRQMNMKESQAIERNLSSIMEAKAKAQNSIVERYREKMTDPLTGQPVNTELASQLSAAMEQEIKQMRKQYSAMLQKYTDSYGKRLRGTAFAHLLDSPDNPISINKSGDQIDEKRMLATSILEGSQVQGESEVQNHTGKVEPSFASGLRLGLGGLYNNSSPSIDETDMSPVESYGLFMGHMAGGIPGLLTDGGQLIYDNAVKPAYDWATTKPSQR